MQELDDITLLRQYVDHHSDEAFAALVSRHVNKVYSVALRHTRNAHSAEEITQAVFVILAKKSPHFSRKVILSGWLYQTARLTALTFIRGEIRRGHREQEAHVQTLLDQSEPDPWPQIAPLLDAAMAGLNELDRHAVVLRFFDGKTMKEVGAALGASEDAAKMRVNRAVEKLRSYFTKRGVTVTAGVLTAAISGNSVQAAPAVLAKSISAIAVAKGAASSGSTLTLVKGALKLMAWTKTQTAIVAGAVVLLAAGTTTVTVTLNRMAERRDEDLWRVPNLTSDIFDKAGPQVKILPTEFQDGARNAMQGVNGRRIGIAFPADFITAFAYDWPPGRVLFASGDPRKKYDFIANLPQGSMPALQRELKSKLGLAGRPETRDMDVLLLKVQKPNAPGLKPTGGAERAWDGNGQFHCENQSIGGSAPFSFCLATELEAFFGMPVVDQTGLTQKFDIDLSWNESGGQDSGRDALKQALRDQLGLELVPTNMPVEMLVVGRAL